MKTKAVRFYGKKDLRLEEFDLPPIKKGEILARIVSDSLCMSSYKAAEQGIEHKRVPKDIDKNPVIIGHEFCGEIIEVGEQWRANFSKGQKFSVQPALNYKGSLYAPGYSYRRIGGNATYIIIPEEVMTSNCLLPYNGGAYFLGSLAEPMSCIIGAFHANYHTKPGSYVHNMDIIPNGNTAILAGTGPMGLGAIDYALHRGKRPRLLLVTDIDSERLSRAASLYPPAAAEKSGIRLVYLNTSTLKDPITEIMSITGDSAGWDDVFVFAPIRQVIEQADKILARDGCLNFFAGPTDPSFSALFNFYNVHYNSTHIVGTSGGNTDDMLEALGLMSSGVINPVAMITHVGGLDSAIETTLHLPKIPGGKKLIYTHISMPLTAISDFPAKAAENPLFAKLAEITQGSNGLWSFEAEKYILENAPKI
jgi:threonine dehydrogenase-like Zn-dependent dehydrogenase